MCFVIICDQLELQHDQIEECLINLDQYVSCAMTVYTVCTQFMQGTLCVKLQYSILTFSCLHQASTCSCSQKPQWHVYNIYVESVLF